MSENTRSLPETLDVDHLPTWQLHDHLVHLTLDLAEALLEDGDPGRYLALTKLYETTLDTLHSRQRGLGR